MKKKSLLLYVVALLAIFSSCEKMPLQRHAEYDGKPIDNNLYMTAWEYVNAEADTFALMKEAILHSGIDTMLYHSTEEKNTFLLLNQVAMRRLLNSYSVASVNLIPKDDLAKVLLYHIVYGEY
ncbi:MAG: hypothetical protein LBH34_01025, partial [Prevotellaceae bacterium]|nr:hypothetical protein [Prevotellaceae bacterium]